MEKNTKSLMSLLWVVFVDSLGWGIAFSVFAALFFGEDSNFFPATVSDSSRYMLYEVLLAIYSVFMFFFAPILGGIADRYGRKPGLEISMLGLTSGFILCALGCYWSSLILLVLGRIVSGITAGSVAVAQAAAIDMSTPKNKGFYLSTLMLTNTLGFSVGPFVGSIFTLSKIAPTGTITFLVAAAMSGVGVLGILFLFKETYSPNKAEQKINLLADFINIKIAFCKPSLKKYLWALLLSMSAFGLCFSNVPVFLSKLFTASNSLTGLVLSLEAVLFSLALMFGSKLTFPHFEKKNIIMSSQAVQLFAYLSLSICVNWLFLNITFLTFISAFAGLMYISLLTMISDATESNWQGRIMGVTAALSSVTWGVGPLLAGSLNNFGPGAPFLGSALFIIVGFSSLWLPSVYIKKKPPRDFQNESITKPRDLNI